MCTCKPGTGGDRYIPYEERSGNESIVYFTRDLSAEGLRKIYRKVSANISGKVWTGPPAGSGGARKRWTG